MRHATPKGIAFIADWEKYRLNPYDAGDGLVTGGFGHVFLPGEEIRPLPKDEALKILAGDVVKAECSVRRQISRPLTDDQFDALVSFTFNCGGGALQRSTLRMKVNRMEDDEVPAEFLKWVRSRGRIMRGLVRRRLAESMLYIGRLK